MCQWLHHYYSKPTLDQYLHKGRVLGYSIDANFAQARSERPRFDSPVIWEGMGYGLWFGGRNARIVVAIRRPGFDSCRGLVKNKNISRSQVVIALALTLEVGGSIPRDPVLIFFSLTGNNH